SVSPSSTSTTKRAPSLPSSSYTPWYAKNSMPLSTMRSLAAPSGIAASDERAPHRERLRVLRHVVHAQHGGPGGGGVKVQRQRAGQAPGGVGLAGQVADGRLARGAHQHRPVAGPQPGEAPPPRH